MLALQNLVPKIFFLLTIMVCYIKSQACKMYTCGELADNLCLSENNSTTPTTITGKVCQDKNSLCPTFTLETDHQVKCKPQKPTIKKQYPGGICSTNEECFSGNCNSKVCVGKGDGDVCSEELDCYFNRGCFLKDSNDTKKTCNKLKAENAACTSDYECAFNLGCFEGFCKKYFSLGDEVDVSAASRLNVLSFCRSGFQYNGFCNSMKNTDDSGKVTDLIRCNAKKECKYVLTNGTIVTKTDVCEECGKSKDGFIYCPAYGGSKIYQRYVDYLNKTLISDEYVNNCNTVERGGVCSYHKKKNLEDSNNYKELIETISTYAVRKENSQAFANAENCIIQIFNQNFNPKIDNPVDPTPTDEKQCPIFQCESEDRQKEKVCTSSLFDLGNKRLNISLFSKSCTWDKEICDFSRNFNTSAESNSTCAPKQEQKTIKRFPGEACDTDNDCYAETKTDIFGICSNKTKLCLGKLKGDDCGATHQCVKGLYCKKGETKSTCEYQLSSEKNCTQTYECANNLACLNNTCKDAFYSLNVGDEITVEYDQLISKERFCKTNKVRQNAKDGKFRCISRNHTDARNASLNDDLIQCNFNQKCNYTISDNVTTDEDNLPCDCGYNKNGFGYCPRGHDSSKITLPCSLII